MKKLISLGILITLLSGCNLNMSTSNKESSTKVESSINSVVSSSSINKESTSSNVSSSTSSSTKEESSSNKESSSKVSSTTSSSSVNSTTSSSSVSSSTVIEEKTLVINPSNFNKLSEIELKDVVENTEHPEEFTFNSLGVLKTNKLQGLKKLEMRVYNIYENLKVFESYEGKGRALKSNKVTENKEATYTYDLSGGNELYILNDTADYRTHVYEIKITYTGVNGVTGGNNNSSSVNSSSSNKESSSFISSDSSSSSSYIDSDWYEGSYYDNVDLDLSDNALLLELRDLITTTHKKVTTYSELKTYLQEADEDPNNSSNMLLFYTGESVKKTNNMDVWNREHVWAQSLTEIGSWKWFGTSGAGADMHHIRPCDPGENSSRGSKKFGTASGYYDPSKHGADYRGDVARILFYMFTRYTQADKFEFTAIAQSKDILIEWNKEDPVSKTEIIRNDYTYEIQGNRNPFIDYPELADRIWD